MSTVRGSTSRRSATAHRPIKSSKEEDNSAERERASPDHEGTVGRYPVTLLTLTRVPWMVLTRYVEPPRRMTSLVRKLATKEEDNFPRMDPSALNTRYELSGAMVPMLV